MPYVNLSSELRLKMLSIQTDKILQNNFKILYLDTKNKKSRHIRINEFKIRFQKYSVLKLQELP